MTAEHGGASPSEALGWKRPALGWKRPALDADGWPLGVRWAIGAGGAHCLDPAHGAADYLSPSPHPPPKKADGTRAPRPDVRTCGECLPPKTKGARRAR